MIYENVDLYAYFGLPRDGKSGGRLQCMALDPIPKVNMERRYPAMLIIPGGAYLFCSPREGEPVATGYLRHGWSAFILDYSCVPAKWPSAFLEAVMAMLYIRDNADRLSIDPDMVCATGFSAGGHLLGCLAAQSAFDEHRDLVSRYGFDARPNAVVFSYPVVTTGVATHHDSVVSLCGGDRALAERLSIENLIGPDAPPAFIWHTWADPTVPVSNSLLLANAYERAGVPFSLHIFEKGGHGLSVADSRVYPSCAVPARSTGLSRWLDMSVEWLADRDMKINDKIQ